MVSGGPMIVTCHSKTFESSTRPAEKPSTGCFMRSVAVIEAPSLALSRLDWTGKPQDRGGVNPLRPRRRCQDPVAGTYSHARNTYLPICRSNARDGTRREAAGEVK